MTASTMALAALGVLSTIAWVSPAGAAGPAPVNCGQVITQSTTLTTDLGPCPDNGIVVGADNVVVNLAGHRIFGTPATGDGAGVLVAQHRGVIVEAGTVTAFDGGVVIQGGSGNTVRDVTAVGNIGFSGDSGSTAYGDGILIEASSNNRVLGNTATNNGPFSGIGLVQLADSDHPFTGGPSTSGNLIAGNTVTDNVACRQGPFCDNDGIRLEPQVGPGNVVEGNTVTGNGLDGISLFADTDHNVVRANTVNANGFLGAVPGDGIRVFASSNLIEANTVRDNAAGGVSVGRRPMFKPGSLPNNRNTGNPRGKNNRLVANHTGGNKIVDLYDSNPGCDNNIWLHNSYQTANPPCTTS